VTSSVAVFEAAIDMG